MYWFFLPTLLPDRADKFSLSCIFGLAASMVWGYLGKREIRLWKCGEVFGSLADTHVFSPVQAHWWGWGGLSSPLLSAALQLYGDPQCDRAVTILPPVWLWVWPASSQAPSAPLLQAGGTARNYIHTFLSAAKLFFCPSSMSSDFRDGNTLVFLVGDPLKLIGISAIRGRTDAAQLSQWEALAQQCWE